MIEVAVYLVVVVIVAVVGVRLGMILAGPIDRRLTPPDPETPVPPEEEQL